MRAGLLYPRFQTAAKPARMDAIGHNSADHLPPEIARRRTFAIISHPDAGKTTLTEKLLLYGGAIQTGRPGPRQGRGSGAPGPTS